MATSVTAVFTCASASISKVRMEFESMRNSSIAPPIW